MENKELVPIGQQTIGGKVVPAVDARLIHEFLEVGKDFSTWIKVQIERARLVENRDYVTITTPPKGGAAGNRGVRIEYHLTIEAGKHIAMMSGTDKGFKVRDYFIECERLAKQATIDPMQILNDPAVFAVSFINMLNTSRKNILKIPATAGKGIGIQSTGAATLQRNFCFRERKPGNLITGKANQRAGRVAPVPRGWRRPLTWIGSTGTLFFVPKIQSAEVSA